MAGLHGCNKNTKMKICQFLSYPDIISYIRTCKANYKLYVDDDFWRYICKNQYGLEQGSVLSRVDVRDAFLDKRLREEVDFGQYVIYSEPFVTKYNNVLFVELKDSYAGVFCYVIYDIKDMHSPLHSYQTYVQSFVLFDGYELTYYCHFDETLVVLNTHTCEEVSARHLNITNPSITKVSELATYSGWSKSGHIWTYQDGSVSIVLDISKASLTVDEI